MSDTESYNYVNNVTIQNMDIVIVRYKNYIDDLLYRFYYSGFNFKVYEKHPEVVIQKEVKYFVPRNKGLEASGYLKYIIEHYNNLPLHVAFVHDHEYSWHHSGSIYDILMASIGEKIWYKNLNSFVWSKDTIEWFPFIKYWYDVYLLDELGPMELYGDFMTGYKGCAQFIVHRDIIRIRSLNFYKRLYYWIMNTKLHDYYSGRFMEYTWHLLWGQVSIIQDKKCIESDENCKL